MICYHGALFALGRDLLLHGLQNHRGGRQILDFVTQHFDAPVKSRFVDRRNDGLVDKVALFKGLVQFHAAHDASEGRLRKLRNGNDVVARAVASPLRIGHLKKKHAVDGKLRVVLGDADLARGVERHFLEAVLVGDAIHKGNDEVKARREDPVKLPQTLDHPGALLRHHLDALRGKHDRDENEENGNDQKARHCFFPVC